VSDRHPTTHVARAATWEAFDEAAPTYDAWYASPHGQRAATAERALLDALLAPFPHAARTLDIGCGTGYFTGWLASRRPRVVGLDRAPAMLSALRRQHPRLPVVLADAHQLPFPRGAFDVAVFVATLEFLERPGEALTEAVRVARRGVVLVALNRWSLGGLSRRWGPQARRPLLGMAHDYAVPALVTLLRQAARERLERLRWASTLFPDGLWRVCAPIPLGDVLGVVGVLRSRP
jgi:ubiquinone/menaquinone biosynthesis C-methylase UbiE